jgi:hypothetical protein
MGRSVLLLRFGRPPFDVRRASLVAWVIADEVGRLVLRCPIQALGRIEQVPHAGGSRRPRRVFRCISGEHPDWEEYREAMRIQDKSLIRITPTRWGPIATAGFPAAVAARLDG